MKQYTPAFLVFVLVFSISGGFLGGCAADRTPQQPPAVWNIGDIWYIQPHAGGSAPGFLSVAEKTKDGYVLQNPNGTKFSTKAGLFWKDKGANRLDFPLWVGKSWETTAVLKASDGYEDHYSFKRKVEVLEEIRVPAGTFSAFRIEEVQRNLSRGDMTLYPTLVTYWYAPKAKAIIKFDHASTANLGFEVIVFQPSLAKRLSRVERIIGAELLDLLILWPFDTRKPIRSTLLKDCITAIKTASDRFRIIGGPPHWGADLLMTLPQGKGLKFSRFAEMRLLSKPAFPIWIISFVGPNAVFSCKIKVLASPCHHLARGPNG